MLSSSVIKALKLNGDNPQGPPNGLTLTLFISGTLAKKNAFSILTIASKYKFFLEYIVTLYHPNGALVALGSKVHLYSLPTTIALHLKLKLPFVKLK